MRGWEESRIQRSGGQTEPAGEKKAAGFSLSIPLSVPFFEGKLYSQ